MKLVLYDQVLEIINNHIKEWKEGYTPTYSATAIESLEELKNKFEFFLEFYMDG